jgi:C-terminal processing protease CtpA/Prc
MLDDGIGYLALRQFAPAEVAGDTAVAAMGFFANADALIVDLRQNGGGEPGMIQLLCSYFFAERTHLNSFERRGVTQLEEYWTLPHVPGKRLVDVPIFVLTSGSTFSAAEEFTYDLKCLKRATIVGERTGGGANPGASTRSTGCWRCSSPTAARSIR